ncbi:two component regulator with propeller domain [Arcicella aurantiaca]|uniref:histidine kinase n=1 Tax=Arcicella aurantiaca TaxID=591202 RepID=A0A316DVK8_9BACT|nr:response regulator [Arcicella aurantiaca]PWK22367.1 two component regulator with propeller domain [Arcicella aurantiaca]
MLFRQVLVLQFLLFNCFSQNTIKQETVWQSIGIKDGLSQGMIYDMIQDREGFLWVATKDGLNRYDGYNFKVFTYDPYNENSISGNICTTLLEDKQGRIWIGTEKDGLNLFDKKTQRFYHANIIDATLKNAGNYNIIRLKLDSFGAVWIFTDDPNKVFRVDNFVGFPNDKDFTQQIKKVKPLDFKGNISFKLDKQSLKYPFSKVILEETQPDIFNGLFSKNADFSIYIKDSQQWIWTLGRTKIYGRKGLAQKEISFEESGENSILNQFDDGTLVIANQEYMWLFSPQELLKTNKINPQNAYAKIPPNCILFTKDKNGNIWIGTRGYGLLKYNPQDRQFKSYLPTYSPSFLFRDMEGRTYFHANYLPTYHFYQYNTNDNTFSIMLPKMSGKALGHEGLLQDEKHQFWMLCHKRFEKKQVLMKFTKDWKLLKEYILPSLNVFSDFGAKMNLDKQGNIWIGLTNGSLYVLNPQTERFKMYNYHALLPQNGAFVQTYALFQDQNIIWIGTQNGLIKGKNLSTQPVFSIYKNSKTNRQSLSNDFVTGIINDPSLPHKYLWVSTKGGGIERLDKETGIFEHFTEAQGLPNRVVYGVLEGDDKNLWMSTNRGIARLNTKTLNFTNFNKSDGIQDDEFNTNSYFKAPSGELFFGGINGFTVFKASKIGQTQTQPEIKIIGLKVNNKTVELNDKTGILNETIETLSKLDLNYDQNLLTLEFGLMNFTNPIKNRFRYQLEGIDNEWVETGTHNHFANYAQLPSGHYTFKVMGTTDGEVWSKILELPILINPPFYRSWWAYFLYIACVCFVLYRWSKHQANQVRLQQEIFFKDRETVRLAELDQLKTNFFANISHEFRTPLTLILAPAQDLINENPNRGVYQIIHRNANRLLELINQLLDISKLEGGQMKVTLEQTDLFKFFRTFVSSFSSLAESKGILFEFSQNNTQAQGLIDKDKIEKVMTNLLFNAFKFTESGKKVIVKIDYQLENQKIILIIKDEGIGISEAKLTRIFDRFYQADDSPHRKYEGTGIGLALVKELVKIMQGTIDVESFENVGTSFRVSLPIEELTLGSLPYLDLSRKENETADKDAVLEAITPIFSNAPNTNLENILLIVDDNEDIRTYIRSVFENDYKIIEAFNGKDGLLKAIENTPDLVISDLMMPEMDGFELCTNLKTDERTSHIPVILLTAKANIESRIEGLTLGADDYLLKPFNSTEIQVRVKNLIEKQEKLRQYFTGKTNELQPDELKINSKEAIFLNKAIQIVEDHLSENSFNVEQFSQEMNMSTSQLLRKMKALTNMTANEFIRDFRLKRAEELIKNNTGTISEIAFTVGFENLSYFSKVFQGKFGKLPSEY